MNEVAGVVVAHGYLAAALVDAAEAISGVRGVLVPISNARCTPDTLVERVREAAGEGPAIIFVDLASGSCAFAGRMACAGSGRLAVITGVGLAMLLDFLFHRDMELAELASRLVAKGRAATALHLPGAAAGADQPVQN